MNAYPFGGWQWFLSQIATTLIRRDPSLSSGVVGGHTGEANGNNSSMTPRNRIVNLIRMVYLLF